MYSPQSNQSGMDYKGSKANLSDNDIDSSGSATTPETPYTATESALAANPNEIVRNGGEHVVTDDLDALLSALPKEIVDPIRERNNRVNLIEIVMDLGRKPEARYRGSEATLTETEITRAELDYVISHIGEFGGDNRAGIERTLHRISCIRNRHGKVIGLTCRVGRALEGTIDIIDDIVRAGHSILLL